MTQVVEDYVSFEIAKLLKEKGFDADINLWYDKDGNIFDCYKYEISRNWRVKAQQEVYFCPTIQMAMKWLREVHELFVHIGIYRDQEGNSSDYNYWNWWIDDVNTTLTIAENECIIPCKTYEEACEAAIKYCLENLI